MESMATLTAGMAVKPNVSPQPTTLVSVVTETISESAVCKPALPHTPASESTLQVATGNKNAAVRLPSRNQSSCFQLRLCRSRSLGGRHGQADQRVAAADLHGRVHRERHIHRNPAPLSRRANLSAPEIRLSGSRSRFWPPVHFGRRAEKRAPRSGPEPDGNRARKKPAAPDRTGGRFLAGRRAYPRLSRPSFGEAGGAVMPVSTAVLGRSGASCGLAPISKSGSRCPRTCAARS